MIVLNITQLLIWIYGSLGLTLVISYLLANFLNFLFIKKNKLAIFNWEMNGKEYFLSAIYINILAAIIAFVVIWIYYPISHQSYLWFNIIASYITNTNLQHFINQQMFFASQTLSLTFLQFVAPATGLSFGVSAIRSLTLKKLGNFYDDFVKSILTLALMTFLLTLSVVYLGLPSGFPFNFKNNFSGPPLGYYIIITLLGNNGGNYYSQGIAYGPSLTGSLTGIIYIMTFYLLSFSLIFLFGIANKNLKISAALFVSVLAYYVIFSLIALFELPKHIAEYLPSLLNKYSAISLLYASMSTNTGASVIPLQIIGAVPTAIMIIIMMGDALPGSVGSGFASLIFIIILTIFFTSLMSGRMPKFLNYKLETYEIKYAFMGYVLHFVLVLAFLPLAIYFVKAFAYTPGLSFTEMLWEVISSSVNNGSDYYGALGNIANLNIITGVLMVLGRYITFALLIKILESIQKKEKTFTQTDIKVDSLAFSASLIFFIFLLVIITMLPLLALGPLSIG